MFTFDCKQVAGTLILYHRRVWFWGTKFGLQSQFKELFQKMMDKNLAEICVKHVIAVYVSKQKSRLPVC